MPEAVVAPAVVPTPKPAAVVTPTTVVPTPPVAAAPDPEAKYKALETDFQRKSREAIVERRKAAALATESAAVKAELAALKKRDENARINPPAYLAELYGEKWHEMVTEAKVNGVAPAQLVKAEMDKIREENDAKWKARDDAEAAAREAAKTQGQQEARRSIFADSAAFYRATGKEFPILAELGGEVEVARTIAQRIESEFYRTTEKDADGNVTREGKVLTPAEAAELIETDVLKWVKAANGHEKYKAKLTPPAQAATVPPSKQQQGQQLQTTQVRRSLTNQITGSTSTVKPPESAKDRRERVIAAYEANRTKG